jgi:hypothetical protein
MDDGVHNDEPLASAKPWRWRVRFSLLTLIFFVLLAGSVMGLWFRWEPWRLKEVRIAENSSPTASAARGMRFSCYYEDAKVQANVIDGVLMLSGDGNKTSTKCDGQSAPIGLHDQSPRAQRIVGVGEDGIVRIWDEAGRAVAQLSRRLPGTANVKFSENGERIITTCDDGSACLWDTESGALLHELRGHTAEVNCGIFSPDDTRVYTLSEDCTVREWDVATGALTGRIRTVGSYGAVHLSFVDDGLIIECGGDAYQHWVRCRPSYPGGVAALPEFWLTIVFSAALLWSLRRDWRTLRAPVNLKLKPET